MLHGELLLSLHLTNSYHHPWNFWTLFISCSNMRARLLPSGFNTTFRDSLKRCLPELMTNTSVNPARSTGVALFVGGWAVAQLWLFWVAPIAGGLLGAAIYLVIGCAEDWSPPCLRAWSRLGITVYLFQSGGIDPTADDCHYRELLRKIFIGAAIWRAGSSRSTPWKCCVSFEAKDAQHSKESLNANIISVIRRTLILE
jgi:hypothetical protein